MADYFKPFELMTPEDYERIGLRCGLEVHQQLRTKTKLFCRCPVGSYSDAFDAEILRHMRPTLSELGEYDGTALMEKKTKKHIYYRIHRDTVCTYEFDDTPPFFMADDALDIALELGLLLRLNMVNELHIARKQYLDGSIPAGFQRTTILGIDGWIPYKDRRIGIRQLGLEEDACREVSDVGHDRVYITDRLGVPLIEVVTEPDMGTPQEAAAVAEIIRRLCRSTGKVRTGYGAAREDVNVSVAGGTRVEIKGVPQISRIPRLIYNEARRQCSLLGIRDKLEQRGITCDRFRFAAANVTSILAKTHYGPICSALSDGGQVKCVLLPGFGGILQEETQEHTTFAKEFSDRVRVIGCLTNLPNTVHTDSASESLYGKDWQRLRRKMGAGSGDALILVWGNDEDTETACAEIGIRAKEATIGIPSDTRQALKDGTNGFERVLPGAERMYPDTDLPPLAISAKRLERIEARLPAYVWDREARYRELGLPEDITTGLSTSTRADLFARVVEEIEADPTFAAVILCQRMKSFERAGLQPNRLSDDDIFEVFRAHAEGRLAREGVLKVLRYLLTRLNSAQTGRPSIAEDLQELGLAPLEESAVTEGVSKVIRKAERRSFSTPGRRHRYLMGQLMKDWLGCVDGRRLAAALERQHSAPTATGDAR